MFVGAEVLLNSSHWLKKLKNKKIGYIGNQASVDQKGNLILARLLKNKSYLPKKLYFLLNMVSALQNKPT